YKSQAGLSRYETIVHSHYNISRTGLIPQPPEAIIEFKNILVHMIQTKLKISIQQVEQQVIMIPYLENQFVGIFNKYINRYSPSRSWYQCIFTGIGAYEYLGQILNDEKW
ncbi:20416_t:CDS:1, partial [Racocetra persica]